MERMPDCIDLTAHQRLAFESNLRPIINRVHPTALAAGLNLVPWSLNCNCPDRAYLGFDYPEANLFVDVTVQLYQRSGGTGVSLRFMACSDFDSSRVLRKYSETRGLADRMLPVAMEKAYWAFDGHRRLGQIRREASARYEVAA